MVTLKDIANQSGVSIATVSNIGQAFPKQSICKKCPEQDTYLEKLYCWQGYVFST